MSKEKLRVIYNRYNLQEDQPDIVTVVDDINYLLVLAGFIPAPENQTEDCSDSD